VLLSIFKIERNKAALGDSEDVLNAAWTRKPRRWTCSSGRHQLRYILALLAMGPALRQARIDDDRTDAIMISAIDALRDIHPSA
jgi:hypothetical protein